MVDLCACLRGDIQLQESNKVGHESELALGGLLGAFG